MAPVQIRVKQKKYLYVKWDNGSETTVTLDKLRSLCPCATCMTARERQGKDYIPIYNDNQRTITSIDQIGSYAIQISWQDGHNTGIYEFPFLKNLGQDK